DVLALEERLRRSAAQAPGFSVAKPQSSRAAVNPLFTVDFLLLAAPERMKPLIPIKIVCAKASTGSPFDFDHHEQFRAVGNPNTALDFQDHSRNSAAGFQ